MSYMAVFPGQGSQSIGMLTELYQQHDTVKQLFSQAEEALDLKLWELIQQGPESQLNLTEHTQPALLVAGVACYRVWQNQVNQAPSHMAGHSLGEYTALVCSGALGFQDACRLVALRGRLMQDAIPAGQGSMAAIIGLDNQVIDDICAEISTEEQRVCAANYNCPGQVVISGHRHAVQQACQLASLREARLCKELPVSVPSHSPLMQQAATELQNAIEKVELRLPSVPVIHNVDASIHHSVSRIREVLVQQLTHPVRWVETIQTAIQAGVKTTIEFGPGRVLLGLNKRIDRQIRHFAVYDVESLEKTQQQLMEQEIS